MSSNPALCANPSLIDGYINRLKTACDDLADGMDFNAIRRQARQEIDQFCARNNGGKAGGSQVAGRPAGAAIDGIPNGVDGNGNGNIDPSLFDSSGDGPDSTYRKQAASGTPFQQPDPAEDQTGRTCAYFTRPLVRPDGGGLNSYADDAYVVYGRWMYRCVNQRWMRVGPADAFANSADYLAERQERSNLNIPSD